MIPNIVEWEGFVFHKLGTEGKTAEGKIIAYIKLVFSYPFVDGKIQSFGKVSNKYLINCDTTMLKDFDCNNKEYDDLNDAKKAINNEIRTRNRKIKIDNILNEII